MSFYGIAEPLYAFLYLIFRRIREIEPHTVSAAAVAMERRADNVRDSVGNGFSKNAAGVYLARKRYPKEQSPFRIGPAYAFFRRHIFRKSLNHNVFFTSVDGSNLRKMSCVFSAAYIFGHNELRERRRTKIKRLFRYRHSGYNFPVCEYKTESESGEQRFRKSEKRNHVAVAAA